MKKIVRLCLPLICLCIFAATYAQNTGDYQSAASGDWNAPSTWQIFNGSTFVAAVVSPSGSDGVIKIRTGHIVTVNSGITVDQLIVNAGGTLTQTSTITMADGTGDDITVNGNYIFVSGVLNGSGLLKVNGSMNWQSGTLNTNLVIATGASGSKTTAGDANINSSFGNPVFTNNGSFTWADGDFVLNYGSISNGATGIFIATGNNRITPSGGNHSFDNAGNFTKNTATGTTAINVNGSSTGTINVNTGTISSSGTFTNTGTINIASGKTFLVSGGNLTLVTGSNSNGAGNFEVSTAGVITITSPTATPATASNLLFTGGNINGADNCGLLVTGGMEWRSGSLHTNLILAAGSVSSKTTAGDANINSQYANPVFTNNGSFTWADGDFILNYGSISNSITGFITATGNNRITPSGGNYSFNNAGTLLKTNAPGTTAFNVGTTNTGSIKGIGTMNFAGGLTDNGIIAPGTSPGLLTINGAQPLSASSTLNIELLNGSGAGSGNDQLSRDGSLTLAGTLTVVETGTVPAGVYTIINCTSGTLSGSFASVNLPPCYTIQVNSTNVQLTKTQPAAPTITASGSRTFCEGGSVTLTSSATTGNTWSNGATTRRIVVTTTGSFTVTFTNAEGCTSLPSAAKTVIVNPLPAKPVITSDIGTVLVCPGKTVTLTSTAATAYLWSTGETTQSIIISAAGSYSVAVTNASGCSNASDTTLVTYDICAKPTGLTISNLTGSSARISWTAVTCAVGYQFEWRVKGTIPYLKGQTTGTTRLLSGLLPNTTYQWRVITGCKVTPDTLKSDGYTNGPEFTTLAATFASTASGHASLNIATGVTALSAIIYPNPATSIASVKLGNAKGTVQVILTDLQGKKLWQSAKTIDNNIAIDVSRFARGTYLVVATDESGSKTTKLVKK